MALTDVECRKAKPMDTVLKLSDGGALQLPVTVAGTKLWRGTYRFNGKQKTLSIGSYLEITLGGTQYAPHSTTHG
jgi:hypothetical protein